MKTATHHYRAFREYNPARKTAAEIQSELELMRRMAGRHNLNRRRSHLREDLPLYLFAAVAIGIPAFAAIAVSLL